MKVYISVDMEGIGGVVLREQLQKGTSEYQEARHLLLKEVNAVIEGSLAGGAREIVVRDAHSSGFNLPLEGLHPRAEYIMGAPQTHRFPGLDESCDCLFLVGYHAMNGTFAAVRDHTMSSDSWAEYRLNGQALGEVGIDAALAGTFGVPVALVTGDDKVCLEAEDLLGAVETVQVKEGYGRHSARIIPPVRVREMVAQGAERALKRLAEFNPWQPEPPYEIQLRYNGTHMLDGHYFDGREKIRLDGQSVLYRGEDLFMLIERSLRG